MGRRAAYKTPETDSTIFFASVFGAALVLLLNDLLCGLVFRSGSGTLGPALLSRAVPETSVRLLFTFFVLIPTFVSFAAIGVPYFLRTLRSAVSRRLGAGPLRGLALLAAAIAVSAVELHFRHGATAGVTLIAMIGFVLGFETIADAGREHGLRMLAAAGVALAALAWCESRIFVGAPLEIEAAPIALVAAGFFAASGLLTTTAAVVRRAEGRLRILVCWIATLAALAAPLVRSHVTAMPFVADRMELATLTGAAMLLTGAWLLRRTPREFRS